MCQVGTKHFVGSNRLKRFHLDVLGLKYQGIGIVTKNTESIPLEGAFFDFGLEPLPEGNQFGAQGFLFFCCRSSKKMNLVLGHSVLAQVTGNKKRRLE